MGEREREGVVGGDKEGEEESEVEGVMEGEEVDMELLLEEGDWEGDGVSLTLPPLGGLREGRGEEEVVPLPPPAPNHLPPCPGGVREEVDRIVGARVPIEDFVKGEEGERSVVLVGRTPEREALGVELGVEIGALRVGEGGKGGVGVKLNPELLVTPPPPSPPLVPLPQAEAVAEPPPTPLPTGEIVVQALLGLPSELEVGLGAPGVDVPPPPPSSAAVEGVTEGL